MPGRGRGRKSNQGRGQGRGRGPLSPARNLSQFNKLREEKREKYLKEIMQKQEDKNTQVNVETPKTDGQQTIPETKKKAKEMKFLPTTIKQEIVILQKLIPDGKIRQDRNFERFFSNQQIQPVISQYFNKRKQDNKVKKWNEVIQTIHQANMQDEDRYQAIREVINDIIYTNYMLWDKEKQRFKYSPKLYMISLYRISVKKKRRKKKKKIIKRRQKLQMIIKRRKMTQMIVN